MSDFYHGSKALGFVHRKSNEQKFFCYFTGFAEGIAASGRIEIGEVEPILATCREFVANIDDNDAKDILEDFESDLLECDTLAQIAEVRADGIDPDCEKSAINRFLGYCAGIACDGHITFREAAGIIRLAEALDIQVDRPGIREVVNTAKDAITDGVISKNESTEIASWIARLVGECYSDTGLTSVSSCHAFQEDALGTQLADLTFVLTGSFDVSPRSLLEQELKARGSMIANSVSKKTDILLIGGTPSRDWLETNRGTKIIRALELRETGNRPLMVSEAQMRIRLSSS